MNKSLWGEGVAEDRKEAGMSTGMNVWKSVSHSRNIFPLHTDPEVRLWFLSFLSQLVLFTLLV